MDAPALKQRGDEEFGKGNYAAAVDYYAKALDCIDEEEDASLKLVLHGNRSMARLKSQQIADAIADGLQCISLDPTYTKGARIGSQFIQRLSHFAPALSLQRQPARPRRPRRPWSCPMNHDLSVRALRPGRRKRRRGPQRIPSFSFFTPLVFLFQRPPSACPRRREAGGPSLIIHLNPAAQRQPKPPRSRRASLIPPVIANPFLLRPAFS